MEVWSQLELNLGNTVSNQTTVIHSDRQLSINAYSQGIDEYVISDDVIAVD